MQQFPLQVAVLIPCLNEEAAIVKVVADFHSSLPDALIYVYDNGSVDRTASVARQAGAIVRSEPLRGKGNVMRRMFADVEADVYVLVDGDDTYHAASAPALVERLLADHIDMVNGARLETSALAYRAGHRFGNRLLTGLVGYFFGERLTDILSGYRVMSRRFVKSFPALASGFEIETELTVHALQLRLPIAEVPTPYRDRPPASASKLRTLPDGVRILRLIARMVREERPLEFFSSLAVLLAVTSLVLAAPVILEYFRTGLVPRLPTAVLSTGLMLLSFLSVTCGMILATVTRGRIEAKRVRYLQSPAQGQARQPRLRLAGNSTRRVRARVSVS
jgi:glycosyltransferase involved in cell wall biosynthesis